MAFSDNLTSQDIANANALGITDTETYFKNLVTAWARQAVAVQLNQMAGQVASLPSDQQSAAITAAMTTVTTAVAAANAPSVQSISPTSGAQGASVSIEVTGLNTNFVEGTTTATFIPPGAGMFGSTGITVGAVTVTSPTSLSIAITIDKAALIQNSTITIQTGNEVVQALARGNSGGFAVTA